MLVVVFVVNDACLMFLMLPREEGFVTLNREVPR